MPSDNELLQVTNLASLQKALEQDIAELESQLAKKKYEHEQISSRLLPDAMAEIGLAEFTLKDGSSVKIKPFYSAKIPEDRKTEAFKWLADNGHGAIVKHDIICSYGTHEVDKVEKVVSLLDEAGIPFNDKESVHGMTLKAFVREQVESGAPFPHDLFGVYVGQKTEIKKG